MRYLTLFGTKKYDLISDRIRYLINLKSSIKYILSHYFGKIKVDFYDFSSTEKTLTLRNVIILVRLVINKYQNHYCFKIF